MNIAEQILNMSKEEKFLENNTRIKLFLKVVIIMEGKHLVEHDLYEK